MYRVPDPAQTGDESQAWGKEGLGAKWTSRVGVLAPYLRSPQDTNIKRARTPPTVFSPICALNGQNWGLLQPRHAGESEILLWNRDFDVECDEGDVQR